mgnify:CR=1 FL=1
MEGEGEADQEEHHLLPDREEDGGVLLTALEQAAMGDGIALVWAHRAAMAISTIG